MEEQVRTMIHRYQMIRPGDRVALALSGGADSVCLFHVLLSLQKEFSFDLSAVHVHHGIRETADRDERFVKELCETCQVPLTVQHVNVSEEAKKAHAGLEETARKLRYQVLEQLQADRIALAHHQADQAETVLLHLIRGSGLKGLGGMQPVQGRYIRPLLECDPKELRSWLSEHGYSWVEDETNTDTSYRRNYVRHIVLPRLKEINPQAVQAISRSAALLRQDERALSDLTESLFQQAMSEKGLCISLVREQQEAVRSRLLRRFLEENASLIHVGQVHIQYMEELLEAPSGRGIDLPDGVRIVREYDHLRVEEREKTAQTEAFEVPGIPWHGRIDRFDLKLDITFVENVKIEGISKNTYTKIFNYDTIINTLTVRTRRPGDYLTIGDGRKKLKDYMIDEKIPLHLRDQIPLLADGAHILWVIGYRMSDGCKIRQGSKRAIQVHALVGDEVCP